MHDRLSNVAFFILIVLVWVYVIYRWRTDLHVHLDLHVPKRPHRARVRGVGG
jgi:hypothetical protein